MIAIVTAIVIVIAIQRLALNLLLMSFRMSISYIYSKEDRRSYYTSFVRVLKRTRT